MIQSDVIAASAVEVDRQALDASITDFAGQNSAYYCKAFHRIHDSTGALPATFNLAAAILGPFWAAFRGVWGLFWGFLILELIAWVRIGTGLWGSPGAEFYERAAHQQGKAEQFQAKAEVAKATGEDASGFETVAANMVNAAERSLAQAEAAGAEAGGILLFGLIFLLALKLLQGVLANGIYERQYSLWRTSPETVEAGIRPRNLALGLILIAAIAPLTILKFTSAEPAQILETFPEKEVSAFFVSGERETVFTVTAGWLETKIDNAAKAGEGGFDGVVRGVRAVLDGLTVMLIGTPWPVVMTVICVVAWRSAGPRVTAFTAASLAYIAIMGYWEVSMETVALVGAAVVLSVSIGIPLGIWFGKSRRAYTLAEPVLDLMQTLPAFVYLIPIIAFFGTGNPPGILATIIFGTPPVVRLTALGMRGVPESIKEAAEAFGATRWRVLRDVEIPLALPSIMAGVNQTILMCLSMVVIISLIGGGGLGQVILEALQFAAKGPGILGGLAILFCAMVIDRIVQGAFKGKHDG